MTGSLVYLWLEAKRQWRNREVLIFRLGLPTGVYLILNLAEGDTPPTSPGGRMVAIAALAAVISGLAAGPSLGEERANGWLRQLRVTPLRPSAAVAAKIVVAMSFALPSIALIAAAAGMFGEGEGLALGWAQWIELVGLMWLATTPITAVGALIGLTFGGEAAQAATTLAFVVLWLAGGIFTPPSQMPDALAAVARTLPSYGVVQVGESVAAGRSLSASTLVLLVAWAAGAGALAAFAWRRVITR
ncbi:MAG TPA: ABC transporter permease [Actinomycetes bacterium]|jgi:ABC-2 type transport system permease protein|nr:ABC transporter permease [Actinomycetes bacterium]